MIAAPATLRPGHCCHSGQDNSIDRFLRNTIPPFGEGASERGPQQEQLWKVLPLILSERHPVAMQHRPAPTKDGAGPRPQ